MTALRIYRARDNYKVRNKFEQAVSDALGDDYAYEPIKLTYVLTSTYTPDFVDVVNKRIVESKGLFDAADRRKMIAVKAQYPDWTFVLCFQTPNAKLRKGSKTTYAKWAEKNGFEWTTVQAIKSK